jgi:hypothetical protein
MDKTNIVLAAVAVVCGVGCVTLFMNLNAERDHVEALEAQLAQLQHDLKVPQPPTSDTATPPISEAPAQDVATKPAVAAAASTSQARASPRPTAAEIDESGALMADPAYRKARLAEYRLRVQRQGYSHLVAELGLSKDEAERFLDLLAEQSLRENESAMKKQPGENPQQRWRQLKEQAEKEIRAFLGEERFEAWKEYVNSAAVRGFVGNGQWTDDTPLSERIAHMERRAALIQESLDRQQEVA